MTPSSALAQVPLFSGLSAQALQDIAGHMQPRRFDARQVICREGEPGHSLFVVLAGLALVTVTNPRSGRPETVARLRRGDVVGEMSLLTDEPRTATVAAAIPTEVLELRRESFAEVLAGHPAIVLNLNRILSRRLAQTTLRQVRGKQRGEAVALLVGSAGLPFLPEILAQTRQTAPHEVIALDTRPQAEAAHWPADPPVRASLDGALASLDDRLADYGTVLVIAEAEGGHETPLLAHMDRTVAVVGTDEVDRLPVEAALQLALVGANGIQLPASRQPIRRLRSMQDVAWLGRHLARTKLGLALGAGGAKGYAHVGALAVLQEAGYTVDYVSGSSIGAMVGCWLAMGMTAEEVDAQMRAAWSPENVAAIFKLSMAGTSAGLDTMTRMSHESTRDLSFSDLTTPLSVMAVDLNTREPAPITDGPLWQALVAATALAGLFPPFEAGGRRLVDGLALVPVPVGSVVELGADVTVSVNLISRETMPAWPGEAPPEPPQAPARTRMLDTLLEVMDLAQLDSSVRHAALADVTITPCFGPSTWRDFHLADLFLAAGRLAAGNSLEALYARARPQSLPHHTKGEVYGTAVHL